MHTTIRKLLCFSLTLAFLNTTTLVLAQSTASTASTLVPPQIASAHTIFISNAGGSNYFNMFTGGPDRGYTQLLNDLEKWNRFRIIQSPSAADLIFEIQAIAPATASPGNDAPSGYNPQLVLRIRDPKTSAILWTTTANVRAAGRQKSRDKGFDKSVAVLVDHVRQLTGEQLTVEQTKATRDNTRAPNSEKILFGTLIGVGVGMMAFGIYKATHMSRPTLPTARTSPCGTPFCPI